MKEKPKVVYHGSQYLFDVLMPRQANGQCEAEAQMGIYAAATMEEVIPFALPFRFYPDCPEGKLSFDSDGTKSFLRYGSINPNGKGYVYVLPSDSFELVDEWEWLSRTPVKPIKVIEISVKDYWHTISFSEEAKKIQRELYGADPECVFKAAEADAPSEYVCKIASMEEVNEKWDTLVQEHPDDSNWEVWKKDIIAEISAGREIPYYGILDGEIICEAYAVPNYTPGEDDAGLREEGTVYLSAFRTVKAYRGKGYFSRLLRFMLENLRQKGFERAVLGVEPSEVLNKQMYLRWGFTEKMYTGTCTYPDGTVIEVEYYGKKLG
ncbi:MAG: GNAT family N-acetyltransferase [Lachnospiraceae bacterium]|nr:GNAT family N-acetyltransferase [Lachnospiraceae bacterium]